MYIDEFRSYCLAKAGVTESFPFDADTLVFKVMGKMFALASLEKQPPTANLKCDPERVIELRASYPEIIPGYHMNKQHWNTVSISLLDDALVKDLVEHSYALVVASLPKKLQAEWRLLADQA